MVTLTALNRDLEVTKFFVEETSRYLPKWKQNVYKELTLGTQTYIPLMILLEFLKREKVT